MRLASTSASASRRACTVPLTPMGIAAFRVVGSGFLDLIGRRPDRIIDGPGGFAIGGDRIFVDATPIVRSAVGREIFPRALDVMEARSAVVLRGLFDDPRFSVLPGSRRRFIGPALRLAARIRLPFVVAQAVISPAAAQRRVRRLADEVRAQGRPGRRRHPDPGRRRRRSALRRDAARTAQPARCRRRLRHARARRAAAARLGTARRPADRAAQRARQRHDRNGSRTVARRRARAGRCRLGGRLGYADRARPRRRLPGGHPARRAAARHDGLPGRLRSPRRRRDRPRHAAVVGRPRTPVRRAVRVSPTGSRRGHARTAFRGRRARRQGHGRHADPPRPPAQPGSCGRRAVLPAPCSGAGRHARDAEVPRHHRDAPGAHGDAPDRARARRCRPDRRS